MSEQKIQKKITKRKQKSKRYPYYSLERSIKFAKIIYDVGGESLAPLDSILSEMDLKNANNRRFTYEKSSAIQFGLVLNIDKGLQIAKSAMMILFPPSPNDPNKDFKLKEALVKPKIYGEIIKKYRDKKLPKEEFLKNTFRQKGIIESSLNAAVSAFLESLSFAGVLTDENKIEISEDILNSIIGEEKKIINQKPRGEISSKKIRKLIDASIEKKPNNLNKEDIQIKSIEIDTKKVDNSLDIIDQQNYYNLEIPFNSGKRATLIIPKDCKEEDIEMLKKFIDAINTNISES